MHWYLSLSLSTGVSMQYPRMLNVPIVLYLAYLTVQEEMLIRVGLTAENGIAYDTCGSLAVLVCC